MTGPVQKKEVMLTTNFHGLSQEHKLDKAETMANAQKTLNYVSLLNPAATAMLTRIGDVHTLIGTHNSLFLQYKAVTKQIVDDLDSIISDITQKWAAQTKDAIGDDTDKAKELGFGAKGLFGGEPASTESVTNSHAEVGNYTQKILACEFDIINSKTKGKALPSDAGSCEIYGTFDATIAASLDPTKFSHLGKTHAAKFTMHFSVEDLKKDFWLMPLYSAKAEGGMVETGGTWKITVI